MTVPLHGALTSIENLHRPGFVSDSDPGAVGAWKPWIEVDGSDNFVAFKLRNAADSGWITIADATDFATQAELDAAIAALKDGVSTSFDTLSEIATELGSQDSRITTLEGAPSGGLADGDYGDVTVGGTGTTLTVDNDAITDAKLRDSAALSVIGRSANSSGDPADIAAGTDGHVLRRSGTSIGFGTVATAGIADAAVTDAKRALTAFVALTDGATITWDVAGLREAKASVTLGGNRTLDIDNAANGSAGILIVTQDGSGDRTLTLPTGSKIVGGGGTAPTLSTDGGAIDILAFEYDGTNFWWTVGRGAA